MNIPVGLRGRLFIIDYVDAFGERSTRRIAPREIFDSRAMRYLEAFCVSRNDLRRFRLDRILSVSCDQTGEDLGKAAGLFKPMEVDVPSVRNSTIAAVRHGLTILAALAWADGEVAQEEIAEMEAFTRTVMASDSPRFLQQLVAWACSRPPAPEAVRESLERLSSDFADLLPALLNTCGRLISADGDVGQAEIAWMDQMIEVLGLYGVSVVTDEV